MCIIVDIDINLAVTVLRVFAAVLTGAALLCWARAGWGLLSAALSFALVLLVVELNGDWIARLDSSVEFWVREHRSAAAREVAADIFGVIGEPAYFAAAVLAAGVPLALRVRSARPAGILVAAVGTSVVLEHLLKLVVGRSATAVAALQQPTHTGPPMLSYLHSFPSGHVTGTATFLGIMAVVLGAGRRASCKVLVTAVAAAGVLLVGMLAIYCRAHTASDVLGGTVLGGVIVAVSAAVLIPAGGRRWFRPARAVTARSRPIKPVSVHAVPRRMVPDPAAALPVRQSGRRPGGVLVG